MSQQQGHTVPGRKSSTPLHDSEWESGELPGAAAIEARVPQNSSDTGRHVECGTSLWQPAPLLEQMAGESLTLALHLTRLTCLVGFRDARGGWWEAA